MKCQAIHCDLYVENTHDDKKLHLFSCLVGLEEYTYLNVRLYGTNVHERALLDFSVVT